jgi:cysteine desulfurase
MKSLLPNNISYFDYNATHPPILKILEEANADYIQEFYNPSGATRYSLANQGKIERVRKYFSHLTGTHEKNVVFSSTGTEANYTLICALRKKLQDQISVIVSPFEHSSMYSALRDHGFDMRILETDKTGIINLNSLNRLLSASKDPIICLHTGNETGVIQPTREISKLAQESNVFFLSDMMQAFGKTEIDFTEFSGYTFSSHKIGGGMGAALSVVDFEQEKYHLFGGGNQENGHRAGTENVAAIRAFQMASEFQLAQLEPKKKRLLSFRNQIESELENLGCIVIAKDSPRACNTSFILLPIEEIDFFLLGMEESRIIISTGSSCKSRAREASASLLAMGYTKEESLRCIRISTGIYTTEEEVKGLLSKMKELLETFQIAT